MAASGFHAPASFASEPDMTASWIAQPGQKSKDVAAQDPTVGPKVKLNYTAATWEVVLKNLAEGTGSVLIADRVPSGRFSRRDKGEYTRDEAMRIINNEIQPRGFRLIAKGQYLIVLDLPSQRPQYQAPIVPPPRTQQPPQAVVETPYTLPQRQFSQVTPVPKNGARTATPASPVHRSGVQLASHEQPAAQPAEQVPQRRHVLESAAAEEPVVDEASTTAVYRARQQRATELAKRVFRTFRDRAELIDAGRNGLPAFRVRGESVNGAPAPVQFSMAIDEEREELLIDAPPKQADALVKLLKRLDTSPLNAEPMQLVASTKAVAQIAPQLPAEFAKIQAVRNRQAQNDDPLFAQADPQPPANQAPPTPARGIAQDILGGVKGPVNIEAIEDLGVIVIIGAEADVAQVIKVIEELEKLSEATAPRVHLLYLNHVNSEALAELLTTVYESLTKFPGKATQPRQNVAILPVVKPNAILIVAPESDLESIKDLAEELDEPVDPQTEFGVFHLESAVAEQVAEYLTTLYEEPTGLGTRVLVQADPRSNSIIVRAQPRDLDAVETLIKQIDHQDVKTVSRVKIFPLKNAVATEMAAVINMAIQSVLSAPTNQGASQIFGQGFGGGGQVAEAFRDVASRVLQFEGDRETRSGILADIRITPDPRVNALVVTAPEASMSLLGQLIQALDQPTNMVSEIKVFTLENADAEIMVQQLQGLFNAQVTGGAGGGQAGQQRQQIGIQIVGAEDASSGLIPLKFSVDTRTNSVIAIGAADALRVVEAILLKLDESDIRDRKVSVYRLKNSPATNIAQSVTQFLTNQQNLAQADPNLISTIEQLEREVIVVAEPVSNSLLISATPRYYEEVMGIIKKLDEQPQQVMIQALIVEVELQDTDEFGVEMGFQDSILFDRSIVDQDNTFTTTTTTTENNTTVTQTNIISQVANPGFLFGNPSTPLGNSVGSTNPAAVGTQGLSNFSLGRINGDLGFGGLVLSASSESVSLLLRALAQNRQVRVLSRPSVQAMDNQPALIQQGQEVPVVTQISQATGTQPANPQVQQQPAGIILSVTPRITPDGNVIMSINAEKSAFNLTAGSGVPIFTDLNTGNVVESPVKDISQAQTVISVPNGQTVVLGGLITSRTDNIHRRVPWLGDVPVLGWAFRYDYVQTRRTELLIFLTPRIISDPSYSEHIKEVEMARLHFIECEAEEIHGPLRGIPSEQQLFDGQIPSTTPGMPSQPYYYGPGTSLDSGLTPIAPQPSYPQPPQPMTPQPISPPPAAPPANAAPQPLEGAPAPQSRVYDPQLTPASAFAPSAPRDRRVTQATLQTGEQAASVKIRKSAAAEPATVRLGKGQEEKKKGWFSRK